MFTIKRTQIQLTDAQFRVLKRISSQRNISVAEIVRDGVEMVTRSFVYPDMDEKRKRAIEAVGLYHSGKKNVSEKHDDHLAEAYST